jgi:hypothetical protein
MLKSNVIQQGTHLSDANHQTHPFSHVGEDFQERMIVSPPRCDVAIWDSDHGNWDKKESFLEPRRLFTNLLDGCERYGYNDNRNRSSSRHRQEARRRRLWVVVNYAGHMAKAKETVRDVAPETKTRHIREFQCSCNVLQPWRRGRVRY